MKAFMKYGKRPYEASIKEAQDPEPADNEVLLEIAGCGICGSDIHAYRSASGYEWVLPPVILGHEFAGTVISTGSAVCQYQEGDRVAVIGIQGCSECHACRDGQTNLCDDRKVIGLDKNGGMAKYAVVNEAYLISIPDNIDLAMAALTEPFSVAAHALSKTAVNPEQNVVVTGPGSIGLFCGIIAKLSGARVLMVGTNQDANLRLPVARKLGFSTVNIDKDPLDRSLKSAFGESPPDLWVEASGSSHAFKASLDWTRRGGNIVIVGMYSKEFTWLPTVSVRAEHSLLFSYASTFRDYQFALQLMASRSIDLNQLVNFYPMYKAEEAFKEAEKGMAIKPILVP